MAMITQTIAIVDKSNKVVGTTKQLRNVFKEAKMAYLERRAEIHADRKAKEEKELRKAMRAMTVADDDRSVTSHRSRKHHHHGKEPPRERRQASASDHVTSSKSVRKTRAGSSVGSRSPIERRPTLHEFNEELYGSHRSPPVSPVAHPRQELARRTTDMPLETRGHSRPQPARSHSVSDIDQHIDMDLAYGEFHPSSLALHPKVEQELQKRELSSLVEKCKFLLDEANCAQHSVRAIIVHLQQNPDAMAAVALTLAEISNVASKMAPGALAAFKAGAPGVFALLAAPEFLIAVGVGVGLTVVMFGGYKIIKKIQAQAGKEESMDEMIDVNELDRIERWRRGITDDGAETASVATSVEGEFITPMAAASMGHLPIPKSSSEDGRRGKKSEKKAKHARHVDDDSTMVGSEASSRSKRSHSSKSEKRDKTVVKVKKPSPLRRILHLGSESGSVTR